MLTIHGPEYVETIVIGGGQAGLAVGYHLRRQHLPFLIVDANPRIGDAWRNRWDSLRLFTPSQFDGLAGMPFPAPYHSFVTKDEMADYLQAYAERFELPVRTGVKVDRLWREGDYFRLRAGNRQFEAHNVVVAMSDYQQPRVPPFARQLAAEIVQMHSNDYRNPSQLKPGGVLLVGAGNSGAEIARELVRTHHTWLSGRPPGVVPFRMEGLASRLILARLVIGGVFHHVLTLDTPIGRRVRGNGSNGATPLVRVKPWDLTAAGVECVGRTIGVRAGLPLLDDGRTLDVDNVIWATGYSAGFEWIDLPVHGPYEPLHERGVVPTQPGLYFVGLHFEYALSSSMVHGVSRDAERIVRVIASGRGHLRGQVLQAAA
jgi:putative flavoprotein involved in K+ transport